MRISKKEKEIRALLPEMRMMPTPPRPGAVAMAAMVSLSSAERSDMSTAVQLADQIAQNVVPQLLAAAFSIFLVITYC